MTDWATAPPGPEMDAACAELLHYEVLHFSDGSMSVDTGLIGGPIILHSASGDMAPMWAPSRGDLAAAFQVMSARPGW